MKEACGKCDNDADVVLVKPTDCVFASESERFVIRLDDCEPFCMLHYADRRKADAAKT